VNAGSFLSRGGSSHDTLPVGLPSLSDAVRDGAARPIELPSRLRLFAARRFAREALVYAASARLVKESLALPIVAARHDIGVIRLPVATA
jgi:hypothetical protein